MLNPIDGIPITYKRERENAEQKSTKSIKGSARRRPKNNKTGKETKWTRFT
jgi:hypothetical protein